MEVRRGVVVFVGFFFGLFLLIDETAHMRAGAIAIAMTVQASCLAYAARRQPGIGLELSAGALLTFPVLTALTLLASVPANYLRYSLTVPYMLLGLGLLTTHVLRAQVEVSKELQRRMEAELELRNANESLEARVVERTAEMQETISYLDSFNRSVAHDLRGTVGAISGAAQMCLESLETNDVPLP